MSIRQLRILHDVLTCDALYGNRFSVALTLEIKMQRVGSSLAAPPRRVKCTVPPHGAAFYIHPPAQIDCSHIASAPPTPLLFHAQATATSALTAASGGSGRGGGGSSGAGGGGGGAELASHGQGLAGARGDGSGNGGLAPDDASLVRPPDRKDMSKQQRRRWVRAGQIFGPRETRRLSRISDPALIAYSLWLERASKLRSNKRQADR
jgi:hypothetical protein